jgi:hypothetical protein
LTELFMAGTDTNPVVVTVGDEPTGSRITILVDHQ